MATYEVNDLSLIKDGDTYLIKIAGKEVYYGVSNTASGDQQKIVTINNLEKIGVGTQISITFANAQTYNGKPTLKINNLAAATVNNGFANMWQAGETVNFVYDGANWLYIGSGVASTNKYGVTKLTNAVTNSSDTAITPAAVNELSEYLENAIAQNVRGATSSANGTAGRVPAPAAGDQNKYLKGDGTWKALSADTEFTDLAAQVNTNRSKINGVDTKVNRIDRDLTSIDAEKARFIHLDVDDLDWSAIWAKISVLENGETALITSESTQTGLLTNGGRNAKVYGFISRRNDTEFKYIFRANNNDIFVADSVGSTSSASGTYTERHMATDIDLTSSDTVWSLIWAKLNTLDVGRSALFRSYATSSNVWTTGARNNTMFGIVSRRSDTQFVFTYRLNENKLYIGSLDGASSSTPGTFTEEEVIFTSQIKNNHSTTDAGYILDARQGKSLSDMISQRAIGQRITKDIAASGNACTINLADGCCCLLVASMPGISRVWVGVVYTNSSGAVTFEKINSSSAIQAEVPSNTTNKLKFTWSYSSASTLNILCIPYRGTGIPSF